MKYTNKYLAIFIICFAQKITSAQEILIGQTIPEITLKNVINHSSDTLNLTDLKGKAIILDYWGFNCTSCLQSFPKVDALQKQFQDKLQILLVNRDSKIETSTFLDKRKKIKIPGVPLATGDSILNTLFPHTGVPFHVWINSSGKVLYTADGEYMTSANIEKFLKGIDIDLPKAELSTYQTSLFKNGIEDSVKYATYIARCIAGGSFHIDGFKNAVATINLTYCNSIQDLYQYAYNESENEGFYKFREHGRTILEVNDKNKYRKPVDPILSTNWMGKNGYYYHSILRDDLKKDRFKIMQQDLYRYFNLGVSIVRRKVKCLALVRTSAKDKLKTKGGASDYTYFGEDLRVDDPAPVRFFKNMPFKYLFDMIKSQGNYVFRTTIIDNTAYIGNIDFEMDEKVIENMTVESLQSELRRYDLDLVEKYILMDVLVLKEKEKGQ